MRKLFVLFISLCLIGACMSNPLGDLFAKMMNNGLKAQQGTDCVACTLIVAMVDQNAQIHNQTVDKFLEKACDLFPSEIKTACDGLVMLYGPTVIKLLDNNYSADEVCYTLDICHNQTCHIFPSKRASTSPLVKVKIAMPQGVELPSFVWPWEKVADHLPALDEDNDRFSTIPTLRGTHWRGRDCNDISNSVYPGRRNTTQPATVDHNCNGIFGVEPTTQKSYEELFCSTTKQYGYVLLGDSAGAHFHVPPQWMTAADYSKENFKDMLDILEDEMDWPEQSSSTGYMNITWTGKPVGPVDSIYARMRERNLCMHRDYQNIAVNGARAGAMQSTISKTMARNQMTDNPVMLTHALIGNDVCNGHYGTDHMTTPEQFYENVVGTLKYLDTVLPYGSHVTFVGLVDGRVLYNTMSSRIHPIGSTNNDVTYAAFYDYLNCLQISPCFGWMNSDEHWRDATTQRAMELNAVYGQIIANNTFKNFDMNYMDSPFEDVIAYWNKQGGATSDLIEPVDGFHPTQLANALLTEIVWNKMVANYSELIVPINPYNAEIQKIFGDQGGY